MSIKKMVFSPPGRSEPGFLRRTQKALAFQVEMKNDPRPETIDKLVDFLLTYVVEPKDRVEAREALYDATEEQFNQLIDVIVGGGANEENPTTAQTTAKQSNSGQVE
jgi:tRNA A37 threonylcarbamoyladenosine dehydratase